jgi:vancomycin permeability regulator SanA
MFFICKRKSARRKWTKFLVTAAALAVMLIFALLPFWLGAWQAGRIYTDVQSVPAADVAIVFGAGLTAAQAPSGVLDDRLKVAADLYRAGKVKHLLVSGDNQFVGYSEPDVMKETLVSKYGVPAEAVHADYAGRRTYDTCIRAHGLWGIDRAILVSQGFHLPRAIWTCRQLGIESVGVSASLHQYVKAAQFAAREALADYKAFIDLYVWNPSYVGGAFLEKLD